MLDLYHADPDLIRFEQHSEWFVKLNSNEQVLALSMWSWRSMARRRSFGK